TAYENVELPLLLHPLSARQRHEKAMLALDLVGVADRADHFPRQLSGGQEQRVAIARAIVAEPTLIVADEPTGDLDASAAATVMGLLRRLNEDLGKTLIMVTHDPKSAAQAKQVLHLEKGRLVERDGAAGATAGSNNLPAAVGVAPPS
ncbi:MAG TPA: ATP-binding cassette domain-containing protein, partial [Tepidisphaeraceae bacterium]|nr:ATP-binding cassette domain-containing protein [Tepidisphaeraceae bacterium]